MQTIDIPRLDWARALNEFTAIHEGWLVSLEILGTSGSAQREIANLPLLDVSADRINHDGTICISVAASATEHVTHIVREVRRVSLERTAEGADSTLSIHSADGTTTRLRFRAAVRPETVDGIGRRDRAS